MTPEEIQQAVDVRVANLIDYLVDQKVNELSESPDELAAAIEESGVLRRAIREFFERTAATEVGNRLRCGIYNGLQVDKIFDSIWTAEFETALQDRAKRIAQRAVTAAIENILKTLAKA